MVENDVSPSPRSAFGGSSRDLQRGVVWLRSGASAPAGLLNALAARGLRVTVVVDAAAALRELIRGGVACLVLHEAWRLARVGELLDTLERYFPDVRAMHFGADERLDPRLVALGESETSEGIEASESMALQEHPDEPVHETLGARVTVTEAELAMLLGPIDGDEQDGSDGVAP